MKIVIEIKANEQSCRTCCYARSKYARIHCQIFHEYLEPFERGQYKRLDKCKEAEVSSVEYEGVKLWQHNT